MRERNTLKSAEASERLSGGESILLRLNYGCAILAHLAYNGAWRDIDVSPPPDNVRTSMVNLAGQFTKGIHSNVDETARSQY